MQNIIRVAIIEDDPRIRPLLQLIIDGSPGFVCTQTYADSETALTALADAPPDLLLLDIDLPGISGIEALPILKKNWPTLIIVMLSVHEDDQAVFDALCKGADGYLVKGIPPDQLLLAIREAYQGGAPMSSQIARKVIRSFHQNQEHQLSNREKEVLQLLCTGENYRTIATQLFISQNTVKAHIKKIYQKLQVNNRAEAVAKAIQKKII